jgi:hypothetical protein
MSTHVLPPLNNKLERKVNSLPPLGFEPVIFGMLAHLSNHSAKSHHKSTRSFLHILLICLQLTQIFSASRVKKVRMAITYVTFWIELVIVAKTVGVL